MKKSFCDKCGIEITSCSGHEDVYLKVGMSQGVHLELCAADAQILREFLSDFTGERVDWHITKAGGNGCV